MAYQLVGSLKSTIPIYLTFEAIDNCQFSVNRNTVSYSIDNGTTWLSGYRTSTIQAGNKVIFKANLTPMSNYGIGTFSSTGRFKAMGNPMSLLYGDDFRGRTDLTEKNYAFSNLFSGCTGLTSAENLSLPATTLTTYCYNSMFRGCTSLTTAPELLATTMATACYASMFSGCTSLATAPTLPATTLAQGCYISMFKNCTSLTTAPELPVTTLTYDCYYQMFQGCTNLSSITCLATSISAYNCTTNWVDGVAASGTFIKVDSMTSWTTGNNGIPTGWTVKDYVAPPTLVDLGLPSGTKWADRNIGAKTPEDNGLYFSWGNVDGHEKDSGYDFGESNDGPYASTSGASLTGDIPVNSTYDAARANLGGSWRMPTKDEFAELFNTEYTTNEWVTQNGINGLRVTSNINGNSVFFPAAGRYYGTTLYVEGASGDYWSSSLYSQTDAYNLLFDSSDVIPQYGNYRFYGFTVRAVQ